MRTFYVDEEQVIISQDVADSLSMDVPFGDNDVIVSQFLEGYVIFIINRPRMEFRPPTLGRAA